MFLGRKVTGQRPLTQEQKVGEKRLELTFLVHEKIFNISASEGEDLERVTERCCGRRKRVDVDFGGGKETLDG